MSTVENATHHINCPNCDRDIPRITTAYGERATCRDCGIRWTLCGPGHWADEDYVAEKYSPITDNRNDQNAPEAQVKS